MSHFLVETERLGIRRLGPGDMYALHAVVDTDAALALRAAKVGHEHRLPLAASVIYATAQAHGAILWTQDGDFDGPSGVEYIAKRSG